MLHCVLQEAPYVVADSTSPSGYRGFCIDLLEEISRSKGFNYTIYRVNTYGKFDKKNGTWNGVMAELINRVGPPPPTPTPHPASRLNQNDLGGGSM